MRGGFQANPDWPRWANGPGAGGVWKATPEDFLVEELDAEPPTGSGGHQWLRIEKTGWTTTDVASLLAGRAGVGPAAIGYAGLKDREARTIQAFSVEGGADIEGDELAPGVRVLERARTARKLRVGHLRGNRFELRIRGGNARVAAMRAAAVAARGFPNYYGMQRVGGDAAGFGHELLLGRRIELPYAQLKFAISAFQSRLFNEVLDERGPDRLAGDLVDDGAEALRLSTDPLGESGIPTGPMYGHAMPWPQLRARALEEYVLRRADVDADAWRRFPDLTRGTRRPLWVRADPRITPTEDGFLVKVELPSGSYATVLLEELL